MTGTVITFYSYKGGVGRSFALANIAVLLGRWGFRVLCIDWDLEAPGLAHFFASRRSRSDVTSLPRDASGLVDLLTEFRTKKQVPLQWRNYVFNLDGDDTPGVSLLPAGQVDESYTRRLHKLNWAGLYKAGLGGGLEGMFDEIREEFDYILIDARTGVTDFSAIITAQLPDILVFLFTANEQSFRGACDIARRSAAARNSLAVDRSRLLLLPVPARFEVQLEHSIAASWRDRFAQGLAEFYTPWAFPDASPSRLVQATTIPYVAFWSFGERLSVVEDSSTDPLGINYSLETIAALLAHRLSQTRLLLDSRDEFVSSARRLAKKRSRSAYSVFLSYSHEDSTAAKALRKSLESRGIRTHSTRDQIPPGSPPEIELSDGIGLSEHMVVLIGDASISSDSQEQEIRTFLRQAAADKEPRLLIPFVIRDSDRARIPKILMQYQVKPLEENYEAAADQIFDVIRRPLRESIKDGSVLRLRISADGDTPIQGASVTALAKNATTINTATGEDGHASLSLLSGRAYTLLVAHTRHPGRIIEEFDVGPILDVRLPFRAGVGSTIIHSTGHIPGLNGRLNPILDTSNRTYLYADNIAIDGGKPQPAKFTVGQSFELEDAQGARFEAVVKRIAGRTALLEYKQL